MSAVKHILLIATLLTVLSISGCQKDLAPLQPGQTAGESVGLNLNFVTSGNQSTGIAGSRQNVNRVDVTIRGTGLDSPIQKTLTVANNQARGSFTLPLGNKTIDVVASVTSGSLTFVLFTGSKTVNVTKDTKTITIDLVENTADELEAFWHDSNFESFVTGAPGMYYLAGFEVSSFGAVFVKSISYFLSWQGNAGDYRIHILDESDTRFRSAAIGPAASDGWVNWDLVWNNPTEGIFTGLIFAGIEYENSEFPSIGYDMSNPSLSSFFLDFNSGNLVSTSDGDFGITLTLQALPQTGISAPVKIKPERIFTNPQQVKEWIQSKKKLHTGE